MDFDTLITLGGILVSMAIAFATVRVTLRNHIDRDKEIMSDLKMTIEKQEKRFDDFNARYTSRHDEITRDIQEQGRTLAMLSATMEGVKSGVDRLTDKIDELIK